MRDRAILSFCPYNGDAYQPLPLEDESFDRNNKLIDQNPGDGVSPKFKEHAYLFPNRLDGPENIYGMV